MEQKNKDKQNIINKIIPEFFKHGAKNLTTNDISSFLGISKKTLYLNFPTKEDLISEVFIHINNNISTEIEKIQQENLNPIQELLTVHDKIFEIIPKENDIFIKQIHKYYFHIHEKHCIKQQEKIISFLKNNLIKGMNFGVYKKEIDINLISFIFLSLKYNINIDDFTSKFTIYNFKQIHFEILKYHILSISTKEGQDFFYNIYNKI